MKKVGGFRLCRRLVRVFGYIVHQRKKGRPFNKAISKLFRFGRLLKHRAKGLCFGKNNSGYIRVGKEPVDPKQVSLPKGHLAVYVGEKEEETCRMVVPVIYFNHPLFVNLLKEAEMVYGFNHPGRIQIPCRVSEFENLKSRIAATGGGGNRRAELRWKHN
ncbi:unnamed protein product [Withania somnifera]